jgi:hypothetical protein
MTTGTPAIPEIDTTVSHSARVWNYWLGGKDWYPVDKQTGDRVAAVYPDIVLLARAAREFLKSAVRVLAVEEGIRQFLDVGTGLPTAMNTHEVAQAVAPESRIVYVDNDPLVLTHARALLTSHPGGATDYLHADLHQPGAIIEAASRTLDFSQPVAVTLIAIMHHVDDYDEGRSIVDGLVGALPRGSYLAMSHSTNVINGARSDDAVAQWNRFGRPSVTLRSLDDIRGFFRGLDMLEPGLVSTTRWRPAVADIGGLPGEVDQFCAVARKP